MATRPIWGVTTYLYMYVSCEIVEWNDIVIVEVRGECVIRGKVLNVQWAALMVHVSVLDSMVLLGSND